MTAEIKTTADAVSSHARIIVFVWLVVSLAVNILMLTGPVYMLQIYNRVLPSNSFETLLALSVLMVAMFTGLGLLDLVRSRLLARVARRIGDMLREKLFDVGARIMTTTGNVIQARRPQADIEAVTNFIGGPAILAFFDAPFIPFYIFIIWMFHPYLAIFAIFSTVLLALMALANEYRLRHPQEAMMETRGKVTGALHEFLSAIEVIRALGMQQHVRERWSHLHAEHQDALLRLHDRASGLSALAKAVRLLLQSGMLGLGAWLVLRGKIDAGMMVAASIMLGRALYPAEQAITHWRNFKQALTARKRLDSDLKALTKLPPEPRLAPETDCKGALVAKELFVAPPGHPKPVLRNINFNLAPGQLLLITGGNGAGKSTLARVLAGIWPPMGTGGVLLDGVDLRAWPEDVRGRHVGYVPQEVQLVTGTIAENISRLSPDIIEEDVIAAARRMGVHEAIKKMGGIGRQVGPGGRLLSAGEQRKVALARAAWGDPVVYILDEPAADLDQESRKALYQALRALKERKRTIVLIDHAMPPPDLPDFHLGLDGMGNGKLIGRPDKAPSRGYSITVPVT